jgi:hypothetical protein
MRTAHRGRRGSPELLCSFVDGVGSTRTGVFVFVIYYNQGTSVEAQSRVGEWTRELIDAALASGGSYCLPYRLHAREKQFLHAYPRLQEFFRLKRRLDPNNRFQNQLWNKYYRPLILAGLNETWQQPGGLQKRDFWTLTTALLEMTKRPRSYPFKSA